MSSLSLPLYIKTVFSLHFTLKKCHVKEIIQDLFQHRGLCFTCLIIITSLPALNPITFLIFRRISLQLCRACTTETFFPIKLFCNPFITYYIRYLTSGERRCAERNALNHFNLYVVLNGDIAENGYYSFLTPSTQQGPLTWVITVWFEASSGLVLFFTNPCSHGHSYNVHSSHMNYEDSFQSIDGSPPFLY